MSLTFPYPRRKLSALGGHPADRLALRSQLTGLHSIRTRWPGCANVWQDTEVGSGAGLSAVEVGMSLGVGVGAAGLGVARCVGAGLGLLGCRCLVEGAANG